MQVKHFFLIRGADQGHCVQRVRHFLEENILLHYDAVHFDAAHSLHATEPTFWPQVEQGIAHNRGTIVDLLRELEALGCTSLDDIPLLKQGLASKTLHTIAHLVDGFLGIDSRFYNLIEDSHWLTPSLAAQIKKQPADYWLLAFTGLFDQPDAANQLPVLRSLGKQNETG